MSGWAELRSLGVVCRPLSGPRPPEAGAWARFRAPWSQTVSLLARELRMLGAERIVLEVDLRESQIRHDGLPRADARAPDYPGIVLSFESRHGPLRYATAEYADWRDNVRAVALSMEALRSVDRYGVSKRGEQYQGWKALPASTDPADGVVTVEQARAVVAEAAGLTSWDGVDERGAIRAALRETHPDVGGDEDEFRKVVRAREILEGTAR